MINLLNVHKIEIKNLKDGEGSIFMQCFEDECLKIALVTIPPSSSIGYHKHTPGYEIIRVISGKGLFVTDGKEEILSKDDVNYCPTDHFHGVKNIGSENLLLYCIIKK
jgi:quercetin dioxygenase-like cupin family protein